MGEDASGCAPPPFRLQIATNALYALVPLIGIYGNPLDPDYWWVLRIDSGVALVGSLLPVYCQLLPMQEVNVNILRQGMGLTRAPAQRRRFSARGIGCLATAATLCASFMGFVVYQLFLTDCSRQLSSTVESCTWWQHPLLEYPACSCHSLRLGAQGAHGGGENCTGWQPDKKVDATQSACPSPL